MMTFETFSEVILQKTTKRRERNGLKKVTKPHLKRAYKRLTEDEKIMKMTEDKQINYFVGWFSI